MSSGKHVKRKLGKPLKKAARPLKPTTNTFQRGVDRA
jgi:hypothetical protein